MYHDNWLSSPNQQRSDEELLKEKRRLAEENDASDLPSQEYSGPTLEVTENSDGEPDIQPVEQQQSSTPQQEQISQSTAKTEAPEPEITGEIDNPIGQFMEDRAVEVRDWIDNTLQGNQRSKDQIREDRKGARTAGAEAQRELSKEIDDAGGAAGVSREVVRAVAGAGEKQIQDAIGFGNLLGDTAKTRLGMVDEDDVYNNVDLPNYIGAERDLVLAEPTTAVGLIARDLIAFAGMGGRVRGVTGVGRLSQGLTGKTAWFARAGTETFIGAIADLIMDPGDGNASNALIEQFPGLEPYIGMFAVDEDDNEWEQRFKGVGEGAIMQYGMDAAGLFLRASRRGARRFKEWLVQNPSKKAADAPAEVTREAIEAVEETMNTGLKENEKYVKEVLEYRQGELDLRAERQMEMDAVLQQELDLNSGIGDFRKDIDDPNFKYDAPTQEVLDAEAQGIYDQLLQQKADNWMRQSFEAPSIPKIKNITPEIATDLQLKYGDFPASKYIQEEFSKFDGVRMGTRPDGSPRVIMFARPPRSVGRPKDLVNPSKPVQPEGTRPGMEQRILEQQNNGSRGNKPPRYEPFERAGQSASYPVEEAVKSRQALKYRQPFDGRAAKPLLTDNTARQLTSMTNEQVFKEIDALADQMVKTTDIAGLKKALNSFDADVRSEAVRTMREYLDDNAGEVVTEQALKRMITDKAGFDSEFIQTVAGQPVIKTLIADMASQAADLTKNFVQIRASGQDGFRQAELAIDRLKGLMRMQILDGSRKGGLLQSLKRGKWNGIVKSFVSKDGEQKVKMMSEQLDNLKTRMAEGDSAANDEFQTLAEALQLADGDAELTATFTDRFAKYGAENLKTTMYNAYLSGLNTQMRNTLGNLTQVVMRPAEMALGSLGDSETRSSALSMYGSLFQSIREGFQVARTAWADYKPDNLREGVTTDLSMQRKLDNLGRTAKTPAHNAAVTLLKAQYQLLASPWTQGPMRMLNAADKGFQVVTARQMAHFDFMKLAFEDGIKFDPKKFDTYYSTKVVNGEVVDERLMRFAKEDTFQEALGARMTIMSNAIDSIPGLKYVVPFVRTPTNIIKRSAQYIPLVGRSVMLANNYLGTNFFKEYTAVMRGSDEAAKAIYRGREGAGIMIGVSFTALGYAGLSTGSGPANRKARESWLENNQPHSIKIGNTWISNRWLGPVGLLMSAYADLGMVAQDPGKHEEVSGLQTQLMYSTMGALFDQSWMKGLVGTASMVADMIEGQRGVDGDDVDGMVAGMARAMIPYQAALRSFNNTLVPGLREYDTQFQKLLGETVPGMKAVLGTEKISIFTGEPVANQGYSALNQVQPFGLNEVNNDPVIHKLLELGVNFPTEFTDKISDIQLTKRELNTINKYWAETGVRDKLDKMMNKNSQWKKSYQRWLDMETPTARATAEWYTDLTKILQETKRQATKDFFFDGSPEGTDLRTRVYAKRDSDARNKLGQFEAASELIELANP